MKVGLNISVTFFQRVEDTDDVIGGARQHLAPTRSNIPARLTVVRTPWMMKAQGQTTEDMYDLFVESSNYEQLVVSNDWIVVPDSGQYQGWKFMIMEIEDSSLWDNPVDYRGIHKHITLKRLTPQQTASMV